MILPRPKQKWQKQNTVIRYKILQENDKTRMMIQNNHLDSMIQNSTQILVAATQLQTCPKWWLVVVICSKTELVDHSLPVMLVRITTTTMGWILLIDYDRNHSQLKKAIKNAPNPTHANWVGW